MNTHTNPIYKNFIGKAESFSESDRTILSVITTNSVDRYNEIVSPEGIQLENYLKNPVVLLNHSQDTLPIGKNVWIKQDSNGLIAQTQFAKTAIAEDVMNLYREGFMNAFSIGFIPLKYEFDNQDRVIFTQSELLEYSCVSVPANQDALALAMKSIKTPELKERLNQWNKTFELEKRVDELLESNKKFEDLQTQIKEFQATLFEYGKIEEVVKAQNDTISELTKKIKQWTSKEFAKSKLKSVDETIAKIINQKLGVE